MFFITKKLLEQWKLVLDGSIFNLSNTVQGFLYIDNTIGATFGPQLIWGGGQINNGDFDILIALKDIDIELILGQNRVIRIPIWIIANIY